MNFRSEKIPYRQTAAFSKLVLDYIDQADAVKAFYEHAPSLNGIQKAISDRKNFRYNRALLVEELKKQYKDLSAGDKVNRNIASLFSENTFTITTAHQTNIFSGPLYFIYKIMHAVKLADHLNETLKEYHFVPLFFIGSEDADLQELNHIFLDGEKLEWRTSQKGAVGRMKLDKGIGEMISKMEGRLSVEPFGSEIMKLIRDCYKEGETVQSATFRFVHSLFSEYGLVILMPDNREFKTIMRDIFRDDLMNQSAAVAVEQSIKKLSDAGYKVQANPREINLFYLMDAVRERIELNGDSYSVVNTGIRFSQKELLKELTDHPERFSPNVILRGLYQEALLPNVAFIGGGGETAYWLQLKELFTHYKIPFPVLILRNSFLVIEKKWQQRILKSGLLAEDFFLPEQQLMEKFVTGSSTRKLKLNGEIQQLELLYEKIKEQAVAVDASLEKHTESLKQAMVSRLQQLEKKMMRAEKRKYADLQKQIRKIKDRLFPGGGLQERADTFSFYYALWGKEFLTALYDHSQDLQQEFVILTGTD